MKFKCVKIGTIRGYIKCDGEYGEASYVTMVGEEPLALIFKEGDLLNTYLSVRYFIANRPLTLEQAEQSFLFKIYGNFRGKEILEANIDVNVSDPVEAYKPFKEYPLECKGEYVDQYSEITGCLWTDEELKVGGHDLLAELDSYNGKYLVMEVKKWEKINE